mmetsp:Transcript_64038/g.195829  ORF Transcript_64038/g.195829 Transcript_64038/m.195829 type:complete len:222 (-) Transcript_64038:25-690(-)
MSLLKLLRAHGPDLGPGVLGRGEQGPSVGLLEAEVKALDPRLPKAREEVVHSIGRLEALAVRAHAIPRAFHVQPTGRHGRLGDAIAVLIPARVAKAAIFVRRELVADAARLEAPNLRFGHVVGHGAGADVVHPAQAPRAAHRDEIDLLLVQRASLPGPRCRLGPEVGACVRAAEAEGRHAGIAAARAQIGHLVGEQNGVRVRVDVGVEVRQMDVRRARAVH